MIAALCVGDAYDAEGAVRDAFVLQRSQTKGVRVLAELAGHSSIAVTQRYIDVNDAQLARAVELL